MTIKQQTKELDQDELPVRIVKDPQYPEMYRLQWEDGSLSADYYNYTRAMDILKNYREYRYRMTLLGRNPFTDAFSDD